MTLSEGERVDQYTVIDHIGSGGIAEVFRVRDEQDHIAALKILKATDDAATVERFIREADVLRQLDHPHIIKIYDQGMHQGQNYIVMQFAEGGSLDDYPEAASFEQVARIITEVAMALDYAHSLDILHRDIKLENILFNKDRHTLLADFGMARPLMAVSGPTATGFVVGTPLYMSPEQCKAEPLDKRTDVYALGVLAYRMLTDFYPFYSRLPVAIMQMHITDEPPLPTDKRADLPPQINDVMRRVLAKRPSDRYQSAGAFAEALSEALGVRSAAKKRLNISPSMVFFLGAIAILAITIALMLLMNQPPV